MILTQIYILINNIKNFLLLFLKEKKPEAVTSLLSRGTNDLESLYFFGLKLDFSSPFLVALVLYFNIISYTRCKFV